MPSQSRLRNFALALILILFMAVGGCGPEWLVLGSAAPFGLGWIARGWYDEAQQTTTCYRNGEPVDCSSLPAELAQ